jgi:hypothetical protein
MSSCFGKRTQSTESTPKAGTAPSSAAVPSQAASTVGAGGSGGREAAVSRVLESVLQSLAGADSQVGRELFCQLMARINSQLGSPTDIHQLDELFQRTQDAGLVDLTTFLRRESTRMYFLMDSVMAV